jgi:hypothetical protein
MFLLTGPSLARETGPKAIIVRPDQLVNGIKYPGRHPGMVAGVGLLPRPAWCEAPYFPCKLPVWLISFPND